MSQDENIEPFRLLDSQYLLQTPWRNFRIDRIDIGGGKEISYSYVEVPTAVYVVPVTSDGQIALIRQYRYPIHGWQFEIPAGSVDAGEDLMLAARRELSEEVGGEAADLTYIGRFSNSAAHLNLLSEVFLAANVKLGEAHLEETEVLERVILPAREALKLAHSGGIYDGQSAYALLLAEPHILALENTNWKK